MASLSQGRTAAAQCGLFTYKSVPVIFEPPCTPLLHRYSEWHVLAKTGTTSARLLVVWPKDSMSQLLGCIEHLQRGALSMVTSVLGTENNHRGTNQGSRADD